MIVRSGVALLIAWTLGSGCSTSQQNIEHEEQLGGPSTLAAHEWLLRYYGAPVFTGEVEMVFSDHVNGSGETVIVSTQPESRYVTLHPSVEYDEQYLVHELFHARYQTRRTLQNAPRLLIEGQAALAQYQYLSGLNSLSQQVDFIRLERDTLLQRIGENYLSTTWDVSGKSRPEKRLAYLQAADLVGTLRLAGIDDIALVERFANRGLGERGWAEFVEFCSTVDKNAHDIARKWQEHKEIPR